MAVRLSSRFLSWYLQTGNKAPQPRRHYGREEYLSLLRSRTELGVRLLDREVPDWWKHIGVGRLDLASCPLCVMGQLFGHYEQGLARLAVWRRGHEYGFALPSFESELGSAEAWAELTEMWRSITLKRRVDQLLENAMSGPSTRELDPPNSQKAFTQDREISTV